MPPKPAKPERVRVLTKTEKKFSSKVPSVATVYEKKCKRDNKLDLNPRVLAKKLLDKDALMEGVELRQEELRQQQEEVRQTHVQDSKENRERRRRKPAESETVTTVATIEKQPLAGGECIARLGRSTLVLVSRLCLACMYRLS